MFRKCAVAALLSLTASAWGQVRPELPATSPPLDRIVPLEAIVNGQKTGTWAFVERMDVLYASREALEEWRVQVSPGTEPIIVRGAPYWPLTGVPGFAAKPNFSNQSVDISFAAEVFGATRLSAPVGDRLKLSPVLPSVFANYDLSYAASKASGSSSTHDLGAIVEVGGSTRFGVLTSSHVGQNLSGSGLARSGWTRLETTFTRNLPQSNLTLRVGDAVTRTGLWGRSVYFGGVQIGTNYALTPGFLTQPFPVVTGISAAPSTVELYVNNVLRQVSQVPAGPFAIDNANALTGSGEARVVVRDILGREIVITQPFFTSAYLLAKGLSDWSAEAGSLRRDLGLANAHYGPPFAAGTWRRGLSDWLTAETRVEGKRTRRTGGVGLIAALPATVLGRVALVGSRDDIHGTGRHWVVGAERQWPVASLNVQAEGASRHFRSLASTDTTLPLKLQWAGNMTYQLDRSSQFGVALAGTRRFDAPRLTTVSAHYTWRFGHFNSVSLNLSRAFGREANGSSVTVTLQIPLDRNRQVTATAASHQGTHDLYATASQADGLDSNLGWRVLGGAVSSKAHAEGGLYYSGNHGRVYGELSTSQGQTSVRAGAVGGVVAADGHVFATRRIDQSFAVVEVKGYDGVGVGIGSTVMTRTGADGIALVPNLAAYQANQIRLEPKDLPVSAEIESIEAIVVPHLRSAVKIDFPVRSGRAALLKIQLDDGEPAPAGATVRIDGDSQEFYVARRGEAYVTGLEPSNRLTLKWKDRQCRFELALPPATRDEIARAGPIICKGMAR